MPPVFDQPEYYALWIHADPDGNYLIYHGGNEIRRLD